MAPEGASSVRVFVRWREQTVFAGEDVKCTVTFKNVASSSSQQKQQQSQQQRAQGERQRHAVPLHGRAKAAAGLSGPPSTTTTRGHRRSALSLSVSSSNSHSRSGSMQWPQTGSSGGEWRPGHGHKRSLSIVSIGSSGTVDDHSQRSEANAPVRTQRPQRGHNRAASLQIPPHGQQVPLSGPQSGKSGRLVLVQSTNAYR